MPTTQETLTLLDKTAAYWYVCGYNDHRLTGEPYIDAMEFANYWLFCISDGKSRPSVQDAFQAFAAQVVAS